ncbi:MAG: T9SS type A sorting domain-containing protein [Bacteroidetes bacterium]|nr:T9SS type A sorting domain-containing protein [Bacteroidota bacterium]
MKPVYTFRVPRLSARVNRFRNIAALLILANMNSLLSPSEARAEGTKQIMPVAANGTGLIVSTTTSFPLGNVGSYLGAPVDQRIYIHIKDFTTEKLYYGFNWEQLSPSTVVPYTNVYMRIYDPTGTQVGAPILMPSSTGAGYISTYAQASFGPQIGASPGYPAKIFNPTSNGDYYVSFYRSDDGGATQSAAKESMLAKYFDLTVVSNGTTRLTGRVHCNEWAFSVYNPASGDIQDPNSSTNATFYGYTPDSVTIRVSFPSTGFKPLSYIIAFNDFGVINNGNWIQDRKSIVLPKLVSPYLQGGFDVFLTPPDPTVYPPCIIPQRPVLLAPVIAGCPPGPYNVRFQAPQAGDYYMLFDLDGNPGFQNHTADRFVELVGQSAGVITYVWDGKDGLGNVVPANTTFPIIFSFRKGRINIPFYDVEMNINGFEVDGYSPVVPGVNSNNTTLYWDDTQLMNRGSDCSDNNNNTTGTGYDNSVVGVKPVWPGAMPPVPTYGRAWNGNGNNTNVTPAPSVGGNDADNTQCNDFGNARLLNTWAWGLTLDSTQTVTLQCIQVKGTVWDDANGSGNGGITNIYTTGEDSVNPGGVLYANLVDPITNNVLFSAPVSAGGNFVLQNCPVNAVGMKITLTTSPGTVGSPSPAWVAPSGWVNTSNTLRTFSSGTVDVTGQDFGIEQLPNSMDQSYTIAVPVLNSMLALNGAGTVASPGPLKGTDPEDGTLGSGKTVVITSVPSNEELYYNGGLVVNNQIITNYNPLLLRMKFTNISATSTYFTYAYVDAANKQDPTPATYTINMSTVLASTLGTFTGRGSDYGNVLSWTAYNETPDVNFVVERSADGIYDFTPIGTVPATGSGSTVNHSFTDNRPIPNTPNYYRLKWTDGSGNIVFSNVVSIAASANSAVLDVSPNPFSSQVTVRLSLARAERVAIRLLDSKGMPLKQYQFQGAKGANSFLVTGLEGLPMSVYFVQIVLADQVFVKKVFNQK